MKKILGLTIAALLVMALVGGGTWAYFSDVETVSANLFSAGTLDLQLNDTDVPVTATWGGTTIRPDPDAIEVNVDDTSEGYGNIKVTNIGDVAGFLDLNTVAVVDDENAAVVSEAETEITLDGDLGPLLDVWMFWDVLGDGDFDNATDTDIYGTTGGTDNDGFAECTPAKLSSIAAAYDQDIPIAATSGTTYISLYWRWPSSGSDNDAQGDTATLSFVVDLGQTDD